MPPDGGLGPVSLFEMTPCGVAAAAEAALATARSEKWPPAPVPGWPAQIMVATRIAEATRGE